MDIAILEYIKMFSEFWKKQCVRPLDNWTY